jgi:hypothetical protein
MIILQRPAYPAAYLTFGIMEGSATGEFRGPLLDFTDQSPERFAALLGLISVFFVFTSWNIVSPNRKTSGNNPDPMW